MRRNELRRSETLGAPKVDLASVRLVNLEVMLEPDYRPMHEGEDYMIELGKSAKIRLPNGTVILLSAA